MTATEVGLLSALERDRVSSLTIGEAKRRLGPRAKKVVSTLSRKGALQRISRGLYLVRPFRSLNRATAGSTVVSTALLLANRPHYIGGLWACSFHRLTSQAYASVIDAFTSRRFASRTIGSGRLVIHVVAPARLKSGITTIKVEGVDVVVSTLERTLLDALDFPGAAGGMENAVQMVSANIGRANSRLLIEEAARLATPSTVQRLGLLLERNEVPQRALARLRRRISATRPLTAMLPARPRRGRINGRWKVIENDR